MKHNKKAFTLIELLVVVLIIGILSAIALPMYQKSVDKAEMAEVVTMFKQIRQAMVVYHLTNDEWPADLSVLDIDIPANSKWSYELAPAAQREDCGWGNPNWVRGWASIRAMSTRKAGGAVFYSIPERKKGVDSMKSGIFCCLNDWSNSKENFKKFCQASAQKDDANAGSCYQGEYIHVRLE